MYVLKIKIKYEQNIIWRLGKVCPDADVKPSLQYLDSDDVRLTRTFMSTNSCLFIKLSN